jgi:hypothetical protein
MTDFAKRVSAAIAYGAVSLILTCAFIGTVWILEPAPSFKYNRTVLTPYVEQGGYFKLEIDVYWTKTCYSKLYRNIIDGGGTIIPFEREVRSNTLGQHHFEISVKIPKDATPGPARWEVRTEWFCNPLQNYWPKSVDLEPINFTIVPVGGMSKK